LLRLELELPAEVLGRTAVQLPWLGRPRDDHVWPGRARVLVRRDAAELAFGADAEGAAECG
jgi:hypothetical protein